MLRSAAVSRIQQGLGFRTDRGTEIISALQEAQRNLEQGKTLPWFLVEEGGTLSVSISNQTVSLPTRFIREVEDTLRYTPTSSTIPKFVERRRFRPANEAFDTDETGAPEVYVLRLSSLLIFPIPDAAYTLTWDYYRGAVVLDTDVTNNWLTYAPEYLIGEAGVIMASDLHNEKAVEKFSAMRDKNRDAVLRENFEREQSGSQPQMGSNQ